MSGSGYEPRRIVFYDGEEVQIVIRERNSWRDQCEDLMGQVEQLTRHHGVLSDSLDEVGSERDILKQENDALKNKIDTMNLAYDKLNRELVRTRENVVGSNQETRQALQVHGQRLPGPELQQL